MFGIEGVFRKRRFITASYTEPCPARTALPPIGSEAYGSSDYLGLRIEATFIRAQNCASILSYFSDHYPGVKHSAFEATQILPTTVAHTVPVRRICLTHRFI